MILTPYQSIGSTALAHGAAVNSLVKPRFSSCLPFEKGSIKAHGCFRAKGGCCAGPGGLQSPAKTNGLESHGAVHGVGLLDQEAWSSSQVAPAFQAVVLHLEERAQALPNSLMPIGNHSAGKSTVTLLKQRCTRACIQESISVAVGIHA